MRYFLIPLLIFVLVFSAGSQRSHQAQANPAVALAPEAAMAAAIGVLLVLSAAVTAARMMKTITPEQAAQLQNDIREKIDTIKWAMKRGLQISVELMKETLNVILKAQAMVPMAGACGASIALLRSTISSGSSSKTNLARQASEGECQPDLRGNPYKCCPDFMKKFDGKKAFSKIGDSAFRILYWGNHAVGHQCCFEWDSLHGRFEVYTKSNHGPFKHMGEKSCAQASDLDDDLCTATYPDKADLLSSRHAPRNGCP